MDTETRIRMIQMIISKARDTVDADPNYGHEYRILLQRQDLWGTRHFKLLAGLMSWNTTSLKRLFGLPGYTSQRTLSKKSETKVCRFLGYEDWDALVSKLTFKISAGNGLKDHQMLQELRNELKILGNQIRKLQSMHQTIYANAETLYKSHYKLK